MIGAIILVALGIAVWLYLRTLGPKPPAGSSSPNVRSPTTATPVAGAGRTGQADLTILYGTQTATAKGFAETMMREAKRFKVAATICDLEEYSPRSLQEERLVVFIVATYGEGEPPDPMKPFYDWLMSEATSSDVQGVKYAVFGLGDRQYKHYAQMGVHVDEQMDALGAERIAGLGTGDAGQNLEEEYDLWRQNTWPLIGGVLGMNLSGDSEEPPEPEFELKWLDANMKGDTPYTAAPPMLEPTISQPIYGKVIANEEMLKNDRSGRSTRRIEFCFEGSSMSYQGGDHLAVLPENNDDLVNEYLELLGATKDADKVVALCEKTRGRNQLPSRQPLRVVLKWFLDLGGVPKKSVLRSLAHYCTDPEEKAKFLGVLRTSDTAIMQFHQLQTRLRTTLGFLKHFSSCKVPVGAFIEFMPRLAPRYFSISSDQLMRPSSVVVTVALVEGGVCTTMLCKSKPGDLIPIFVRKSTFHLPLRDKQRPVIMIGPGTGVAPLIGFCERREAWQKKGQEIGPAMLFFGCRNKDSDFIHESYLRQCEQAGVLTTLDACFSRDQKNKVYVQHRLAARAAEVWGLLERGANIYICGDAKHMAKDVEAALLEAVFQKAGGLNEAAALQMLGDLVKRDRYHKDVWSA